MCRKKKFIASITVMHIKQGFYIDELTVDVLKMRLVLRYSDTKKERPSDQR